ncbi:AAA family ATPase, partial [Mycoplasma nasistruthionis]
PNGSGKSNVQDAIKWVLGEQRSKEMRGESMQDLIFAGSATVKALDTATVTLTFDNRDSNNSIPEEIVTITRELSRGKGTNNYYLNGKPCRHKDIKKIAMETGVGKSSLAIISQGTVSSIAESSDEERRAIFEEAAGVSKYKVEKSESISNLTKAENSLAILRPKVKSLFDRLEPLKEQAEKAQIFLDKSKQLEKIEVGYLVYDIEKNSKIIDENKYEVEEFESKQAEYEDKNKTLKEEQATKNEQLKALNNSKKLNDEKAKTVETKIKKIEQAIATRNARTDLIKSGDLEVKTEKDIEQLKQDLDFKKSLKSNTEKQNEEEKQSIDRIQETINNQQEHLKTARADSSQIEISLNKSNWEIKRLKEIKDKRNNLHKGTKTVVNNKALFKGFKGLVSDLLKVELEHITAIETILSAAFQNVVVDTPETAAKAVKFLKENEGGRATFIPLTSIKPREIRDDHLLMIQGNAGFVAVASDLVKTEPQFDVLNKFLLGNVIVAKDIDAANVIAKIVDKKYLITTLDGDVVRVGGVIHGGSAQLSDNEIGIDSKINKYEQEKIEFENQKKEIDSKIRKLTDSLNSNYDLLNKYKEFERESKQKIDSLETDIIRISEIISSSNIQSESAVTQDQLLTDYNELLEADAQLKKDTKILEGQITITIADIGLIAQKINEEDKAFSLIQKSYNKKSLELANAKRDKNASEERLSETYELSYEYAKQNYQLTGNPDLIYEEIKQLRRDIKELGNVNINAIAEVQQVEEEYNRNNSNLIELEEAKNKLFEAIQKLDEEIVTRLTKVVNDVNLEFENVFKSMFGGGRAEVKFVDPSDILESGISIYAQPPGKSVKSLRLFSGGEKALIAISLLFAILRARPLPLCLLDEVEAALDEGNVIRYAEYLQELKHQTQFLVITHRTGTMSKVDRIIGASMQNRGATTFVTVKLSDVEEYIDPEYL